MTDMTTGEFLDAAMAFAARVERANQFEKELKENTERLEQAKYERGEADKKLEETNAALAKAKSETEVVKAAASRQAAEAVSHGNKLSSETVEKAKAEATAILADAENRARSAKIDVDSLLAKRDALMKETREAEARLDGIKTQIETFRQTFGA